MRLKTLMSLVRKAVDDYNMIEAGDKIAVGLSGGKDSVILLIALNTLKKFYPKHFEIEAITISLGFENMNFDSMSNLCKSLNINYTVENTNIGKIIFDERKEKNPCSLCSKLRKGALNNVAKNLGCNRVALGHNKNDIVETFFLSLFYESQIYTFSPVTFLDRKQLYSIRPLMYVNESDIKSFVKANGIEIVHNQCPANGNTKRADIKQFISQNQKMYENLSEKVFGAIKRSNIDGWKLDSNSHKIEI